MGEFDNILIKSTGFIIPPFHYSNIPFKTSLLGPLFMASKFETTF
jgi:hypothetical protein